METLFNINQAAYILKVHPLTVRRYIKEKRLKAFKIGGNVRIKEQDLLSLQKDFSPNVVKKIKSNSRPAAEFTQDDPFLRLQGRGASLHLEK